jgi:hypothetical protein
MAWPSVEISKFRCAKVAREHAEPFFGLIEIKSVPHDPCGAGDQML